MKRTIFFSLLAVAVAANAQTEFKSFALDAAGIQATVDTYRSALGPLNPNQPGIQNPNGRREINWDGVPDQFSSPNDLPAGFFNSNSPRGAVFSGASAFRVSADDSNPTNTPTLFSDLNPDYAGTFSTFSPQRLFSAVGSLTYDVNFFVAGSNTGGLTRGFGAVFSDVDMNDTTMIEYFDKNNVLMHTVSALGAGNFDHNKTLSFVGVTFADAVISRVRITTGNVLLGGNEFNGHDVVVADDFIYAEVVPEPASMVALGLGLAAFARRRRKA